MSFLQMSFSGAILILAVIVVRAAAIHRLPKNTFLILWGIVLLRLLLPFSIPSAFSVYSFVGQRISVPAFAERQTESAVPAVSAEMASPAAVTEMTEAALSQGAGDGLHGAQRLPSEESPSVSVWFVVWCVGAMLCGAYFLMAYLRCLLEFRTSLPVCSEFPRQWMEDHPLRRKVSVRQSDKISAPLTYGIFCPVLLLPKQTDWENAQQLRYIFLHEYVHIRRFDTVTKLISAFALCIHWFNPFVWAMYVLFNRDMELSCDECVVRRLGETSKAAYASMLIDMEARKSKAMPFCSSFSKSAIEERITAIMRIRKLSIFAILAAAGLITLVTAAFVTSAAESADTSSVVPGTDFTEEEYVKLLALRLDGYEDMSVSEYQSKVWELTDTAEYRDLLERVCKDEALLAMRDSNEDAAFLHYVLIPLTAEEWQTREYDGFSKLNYPGASDNATLEFAFTLTILNSDALTVGEYDAARCGMMDGLREILQNQRVEQLQDGVFMKEAIRADIKDLAGKWSSGKLQAEADFHYTPLILEEDGYEEAAMQLRQEEWERVLAPYLPFGITYVYDAATDDFKMYFHGKEVRGILDETAGIWITEHSGIGAWASDENAVELFAVYQDGELVGLREATKEENEEFTQQRQQSSEEAKKIQEERTGFDSMDERDIN